MSGEQLELVRAVLGLAVGEIHIVREPSIFSGTAVRYEDGWAYWLEVSDRNPIARALIGFMFHHPEDMADFLLGEMGARLCNLKLVGERL